MGTKFKILKNPNQMSYSLGIWIITTVFSCNRNTFGETSSEGRTPFPVPRAPIDLADFNPFATRHCIAFITNFAKVDLVGGKLPVIIYTRIRPMYEGFDRSCQKSDFIRFPLRSKPWNCQLELDLFPAGGADNNECNIWEHDMRVAGNETDRDFWTILPSRVASIHIFALGETRDSDVERYGRGDEIRSWMEDAMTRSTRPRVTWIRNKIFFLAKFTEAYDKLNHLIQLEHISPYHRLDLDCDLPCSKSLPRTFGNLFHPVGNGFIDTFPQTTNWEIPYHITTPSSGHIVENFYKCKNVLSHDDPSIRRPIESMIQEMGKRGNDYLMAHAIVHGWISIMQNYSYAKVIGTRNLKCVNGVTREGGTSHALRYYKYFTPKLSVTWGQGRKIHLPMYIPDPFKVLQFVSCGRRGWEPFPFRELFRVYDNWIWLCIAISISSLAMIWRDGGYLPKLMSILKVLVEQGSPFPDYSFVRNAKLRLLLGTYLLMGVVLSNAYKNSNIYNMVAPRRQLHYQTLEQLARHNFSIYSRSGTASFPFWYSTWAFLNSTDESEPFWFNGRHSQHTLLWTIHSEVQILNMGDDGVRYYENDGVLDVNKVVEKETRLYPMNLVKVTRDRFSAEHPNYWHTFLNTSTAEVAAMLERLYLVVEEQVLLKSISGCSNKTALVAPPNVAQKYKRRLEGKDAYLGKELYLQPGFQFKISGMVRSSFLVRLAYFKESGILERWKDIISSISDNGPVSSEVVRTKDIEPTPARASIQGNILVVFALVVGGLILATFAFVLELSTILASVKFHWYRCRLR